MTLRHSPSQPVRTGLRRLVAEHPMIAFVALTLPLSWWLVPLTGFPLGSGPFMAGLIVLALTEGRAGIKTLFRSMARWRVGGRWWAAAICFPAVASFLSILIAVRLGAADPGARMWETWTAIPATFAAVLLIPAFGPWEEPGFRGFALSRLSRNRSPLIAGLLVGVIHVAWHTPLFFTGDIPPADVVLIMAASVVFAWLVTGSGGSVLLAMVMHAANNAFSGEYASELFSGSDADLLGWVRAGLWCVIAVAVVISTRRNARKPALDSPVGTVVARV